MSLRTAFKILIFCACLIPAGVAKAYDYDPVMLDDATWKSYVWNPDLAPTAPTSFSVVLFNQGTGAAYELINTTIMHELLENSLNNPTADGSKLASRIDWALENPLMLSSLLNNWLAFSGKADDGWIIGIGIKQKKKKQPEQPSATPIPAALPLLGTGLFGLVGMYRKKKA